MREKLQELLRNRKRLTLTIIFGPAFLFIFNIAGLVYTIKVPEKSLPGTYESKLFGVMDLVTVILGTALSFLYGLILEVSGIQWKALWNEQLHNSEIHQPVWTGALPTVILLLVIGVTGYIVLLFYLTQFSPVRDGSSYGIALLLHQYAGKTDHKENI